ncbi:MAG TPA: hypothetical protein G4O11_07505 [Anaerolineae bacterium]|nr:hypothetical protein [Anaerolineae bacterium]
MVKPRIDAYRFGRIEINGQVYHRDVIILPDRVLPNWWRVEGHTLKYEDLQQALGCKPSVLVIGLGSYSRVHVPEDTRNEIEGAGIKLIALPTGEACETYNQLREEERVVAALHLTC